MKTLFFFLHAFPHPLVIVVLLLCLLLIILVSYILLPGSKASSETVYRHITQWEEDITEY